MTIHDPHDQIGRTEGHGGERQGRPGAGQRHEQQGMDQMAEQVTRHYDTPAPHSHWPDREPFPPGVMRGLALGATLGAALGMAAGYLLANNILVVPGWELMYSGAPATIITLWAFLGVALGVATVGVAALLAVRAKPGGEPAGDRRKAGPPAERERAIGER